MCCLLQVNTAAIHSCVEAIVDATPGRFVLAPVLQVLETSKYEPQGLIGALLALTVGWLFLRVCQEP